MVLLSPYHGSEPYIFISYAHKDSAVVLPILQRMQESGFRVWYDEGIQGGVEWPEFIAMKLFSSSCVVAFISRNSVNSKNCRREINFAIDKDKPLLVIYLDDGELPLGMQLQLNTLQALYCLSAEATEPLLQRLKMTELLQLALETAEEESAEVQEVTEATVELQPMTEKSAEAEPTAAEEPELPAPQEETKAPVLWQCTCGKEHTLDVRKCSCGSWRCTCGRIHASYVSSCICGLDRRGESFVRPAVNAAPQKQGAQESRWRCTCGRVHMSYVSSCICGQGKVLTERKNGGGSWRCTCGRVHMSYVSTCICGQSKSNLT